MASYSATVVQGEEKNDPEGKRYVAYQIRVTNPDNDSWQVFRRYSDFLALHEFILASQEITAMKEDFKAFEFPKKEFAWLANDTNVIQKRSQAFDAYVILLAEVITKTAPPPGTVEAFLGLSTEAQDFELARQASNIRDIASAKKEKAAAAPAPAKEEAAGPGGLPPQGAAAAAPPAVAKKLFEEEVAAPAAEEGPAPLLEVRVATLARVVLLALSVLVAGGAWAPVRAPWAMTTLECAAHTCRFEVAAPGRHAPP
eukprot:CAMPEP_0206392494 /NCGR_PEP_ID=MMETSP0294-20121207/20012_1 /ASSEMBLY_ACC=CAM_ASM_000327 /TAXON_ID=39354 /ORGANISM="Heterosigma akashiwo, Strain CCMP2393" /LENGTH=255 /DNA_ID=CAMNT_0053845623 /DNA_START=44 /DNA_END=808 /DNA_ORIENTATION=+